MNKIFITLVLLSCITLPILGCDMFVLQSIDNYPFFTLPNSSGEFNDYADFFEDFKSQANQSSGNRDGYGVVAYERDNPFVNRDLMWYKTGMGNYFDENNIDEPLYEAMAVLYDNPDINRVLVHARSGTGGEGNHPFIFNTDSASFTFMHNGYVFNTVKQEILNFLGKDWFLQHPSQWEGDFESTSTFIDSELLFHYVMYYILKYPNDIPTAFRYAFNNKQVGSIDMEYIFKFNNSAITNFILSDGVDTYAYRSSKIIGDIYNLSYQSYPNHFVAVKTGTKLANTLAKNQLIKITPQGEIIDLSINPILQTNFISKYVENTIINQYMLRWQIQPSNQIKYFNIYRSINQNYSNAVLVATVDVETLNQTKFSYLDNYESSPEHYYWIEVVFTDETSEITSNIPSFEQDSEPDIFEVTQNISLYPNPFQDKLNISIDTDQNYSIKVFNLKGQLVDQLTYTLNKENTLTWDSTKNKDKNLPNGIYILKFKNAYHSITKKIMKIK